jgi:hypothetical protein
MTPYGHANLQHQIAQPMGVGHERVLTIARHEAERVDAILQGVVFEQMRVPLRRMGPYAWRAEMGSYHTTIMNFTLTPGDAQRMQLRIRVDHTYGPMFWVALAVGILTLLGWVFIVYGLAQTHERAQRTALLLAISSRVAQQLPEPPPGGYRGM